MLLRANKFRKDKESDCRRNELGSRIFMGRVFGDYAKCLHFYPGFSYGRIIAGERPDAFLRLAVRCNHTDLVAALGDIDTDNEHNTHLNIDLQTVLMVL